MKPNQNPQTVRLRKLGRTTPALSTPSSNDIVTSRKTIQRIIRTGQQVDPIILQAIRQYGSPEFGPALAYHFKAGGKKVRAATVLIACAAAGGPMSKAMNAAAVVEMIHNYSLVMDDIIDRAAVRRGKPSVRVFLGESIALLVAMAYRELLDHVIEKCAAREKIRDEAVKAMMEIIEGERLDLQFEQSGRADPYLLSHRISRPGFSRYLDMIGKKTASLFRTAGKAGGFSAHAGLNIVEALGSYGWNMGIAFQVMDDALDICGRNTGKQQGKDIMEHKLGNAAVLIGLKYMAKRDRTRFLSILRSETVTPRMAAEATNLVRRTPAELSCREIARSYSERAKRSLSVVSDSTYKRSLFELCDALVHRSF